MKRTVVRNSWRHLQHRFRKVLATGRAYFVLSLCSMVVFIMLGLAGMLQNTFAVSPSQSMKGFAASVPGRFFESLLGFELPHMPAGDEPSPFQAGKLAAFLVRFLTDLNPDDPKSLLALEMPGMVPDQSVLLRPGSGGGDDAPEDHGPIDADAGQESVDPQTASPDAAPSNTPDPGGQPPASPPSDSGEASAPADSADNPPPERSTGENKVVFIYHSHNRESWLPELQNGSKDPTDSKINVTLVGKRLAQQLEAKGVGAAHSSKDYASSVKTYNWNYSYKYSLQTVKQALAGNKNLKFFFDIHRDSQPRSKTTTTIRGTDYAQVFFIIGHRNPNWKQNEEFASRIQERLEKDYPGLSRGIWGKTAATGNGEYNQSVSPDSVLIEIGGKDNTLKECYRTADALAEVIADLYWENQDAVKVNGNPPAEGVGND